MNLAVGTGGDCRQGQDISEQGRTTCRDRKAAPTIEPRMSGQKDQGGQVEGRASKEDQGIHEGRRDR